MDKTNFKDVASVAKPKLFVSAQAPFSKSFNSGANSGYSLYLLYVLTQLLTEKDGQFS
jgi:hypothetical protein